MKRIGVCRICGAAINNRLWEIWGTIPYCNGCGTSKAEVIIVDEIEQIKIKQSYKSLDHEKKKIIDDLTKICNSGVREIFTPFKPIDKEELFSGRKKELQQIISSLNTPGRHVMIYGNRGVGKSSLANVASSSYKYINKDVYIDKQSCSPDATSFGNLISDSLASKGIDLNVSGTQTTDGTQITAGNSPIIPLEGSKTKCKTINYKDFSINPINIADKLSDLNRLLIIDECESLNESQLKHLAYFIKRLSDNGSSSFKLLIVCTNDVSKKILDMHSSLWRIVVQISLEKMSDNELTDIIRGGLLQLNEKFNQELDIDELVISKIVQLSNGYPYYTHLLALKCIENAIISEKKNIELYDLKYARNEASLEAAGMLKHYYDEITELGDLGKRILIAAAQIPNPHFTIADIIYSMYKKDSVEISLFEKINDLLQDISSKDGTRIFLYLENKKKYRFSDPRMAGFIRIISDKDEDNPQGS